MINEFGGVGAPVFSRGGAAGAISHGEMGGLATKLGFYFGISTRAPHFFTPSAQVALTGGEAGGGGGGRRGVCGAPGWKMCLGRVLDVFVVC